MNRPRFGSSGASQPPVVPPAAIVVLVGWILVSILLALLFISLAIPTLIVAAVLGSVVLPSAWIFYLRRRSAASRHLHLTLDRVRVRAGETVQGHLELRTERPLVLHSLEASARGGEKVEIVVSTGQVTTKIREESLVLDEALLLQPERGGPLPTGGPSETLVQPGRYHYGFAVTIPETALPSFQGSIASVRYVVRVRARLLRRIDAVKEIEIPVVPSAVLSASVEDSPTPTPPLLDSDRPQLVVELEDREVNVGGTLQGHITVRNLQDRRIEGVRLRLREREWGTARGRKASRSKTLLQTEVAASGGVGGLIAPFFLVVPAGAKASYVGQISSVRHHLRIRVRLAWARDLKAEEEVRIVSGSS